MTRKLVGLLLVLGFIFALGVPGATHAQSAERIDSFVSQVELSSDGFATVTDEIVYDFGDNQRRGIFRDIPSYYYINDAEGYIADIVILGVERNDQLEPYVINSLFGTEQLKIGMEDVFISGVQTYTISYRIGPIAIAADDGNEIIRFDAPGTGWNVSVESAQIEISGPTSPVSSDCYQGAIGQTNRCTISDMTEFRASDPLTAQQTITAEAVYPAGTFSQLAKQVVLPTDEIPAWIPYVGGLAVGAGLGFGVIKPLIARMRYHRRRKQELVVAMYEPPKGMSPAEVGLLVDNSSDGVELSAVIIALATNGFLKIEEVKLKKWYRQAEYILHKTNSEPDGVVPRQQRIVYDGLFAKDATQVSTKTLAQSTSFHKANNTFHKALKSQLEQLGFYKKAKFLSPDLNSRMSDAGYKKWSEIEGFREFLRVTQADRLAFHDAPERKPEQFSEYLPFAVALGVEKQWAAQFKDLDIRVDDWYSGKNSNPSAIPYVVASLSNGLSSTAQSAARASSGSSGSGGGFSGGGFGGGGGGSW